MGRPRGKSKKPIDAASNDDEDGSGGEDAPPPTPKRRGRPQKPYHLKDDDAGDKDAAAEVEDADAEADAVRRAMISKDDSKSAAESGGKKRRRRRRRPKRSPDDKNGAVGEDEEEGHVMKSRSNGFRPNGSRRKSTPRRAAEAGVECSLTVGKKTTFFSG